MGEDQPCFLDKLYCQVCVVTTAIPWLESPANHTELYGTHDFSNPEDQEQ